MSVDPPKGCPVSPGPGHVDHYSPLTVRVFLNFCTPNECLKILMKCTLGNVYHCYTSME
jgi:hypothetical protein